MARHRVTLRAGADLDGFRQAVRWLIAVEAAPEDVVFGLADAPDLLGAGGIGDAPAIILPRGVGEMIGSIVCHRDPQRYASLYALVWRISRGERALLEVQSDPLVHRLERMWKSVRRDLHKMHAFLRFRSLRDATGEERYIAWFEPDHFILDAAAPFFVERFRSMDWRILTPIGSLHWDRERLVAGPPAKREEAPTGDAFEDGWTAYYESIFNPARVNPTVMRAHMPRKYWRNLPETAAIPDLVRTARAQVQDMVRRQAPPPVRRDPVKAVAAMATQDPTTLEALNRIIAAAEPLVPGATRAVLGEGPIAARIAFVGEQPGDQEDLEGRPFVGPAGQVLDHALALAGIDRGAVYLTNAVKHFKFERRGERRIHARPTAGEVKHYRWWLEKELDFVRPGLVVALGATAVLALAGKALPIAANRGPARFGERPGFITTHPSYILRLPDAAARREAEARFVADMRRIAVLGGLAS
ncbi:MAG TPA: UdgX family uracil-DNA binding protein [Roseomonas sp.]|jgi:DNA polymerase